MSRKTYGKGVARDLDTALALDAVMGTDGRSAPAETIGAPATLSILTLITYLNVDGTDAHTLPNGTYIGQQKFIIVLTAANTPAGSVGGLFRRGANDYTTIASLSTAEDSCWLVWNGTRWEVPFHVGCTFS